MLMHLVKMRGLRIVLRQNYVRSLILLGGFCGSSAMKGINKIISVDVPEVECITKGKVHK